MLDMHTIPFSQLELSKDLQKAISDMGFEEASPIQTQAIPLLLKGRDIIGQAQTGTGKTAAFAIPAIEKIDTSKKNVQAVILCPTRELAIQVAEEFQKLLKYNRQVFVIPIYGGQPIQRQMEGLRRKPQIIIATPGRLMDHIERKTISLKEVDMIVLDEADEMLNMGFREDIENILNFVPGDRQTVLFSATMPPAIAHLTKKYQKNPQHLKIEHKKVSAPAIEQFSVEVNQHMKLEVLARLIDVYNIKSGVVFCNTKRQVDDVVMHLQARGYSAESIHGDLRQVQRDRVMKSFKDKKIDVLVATDVAARGIDVEDLEAVFNYDIPQDEEYYVHRIGRTGRAGKSGRAFTFVSSKQRYWMRQIQKHTKATIMPHPIPSLDDVEDMKFVNYSEKIAAVLQAGKLDSYSKRIEALMEQADYSTIDIAAALLKLVTATPKPTAVSQSSHEQRSHASPKRSSSSKKKEAGMTRLWLNLGIKDNIRPGDIVGAFAGECNIPGESIGAISIKDDASYVDVLEDVAEKIVKIMNGKSIRRKKVTIRPA